MKKDPLTTGEIAEHCHVSYRTVLVWIEEGKLRSYTTPGGHNRVKIEDFVSFLKKYNMPVPDGLSGRVDKKRILIVDDDKNIVNAISRILKQEGRYDLDYAFDGFDAGRKLFEFMPDLVILDIRMPGIDGYEVAKRMKSTPYESKISIIVVSGYFESNGKEKMFSIGVDACIDKPFKPEELVEKVKELVG
jgi:excisionase family DNA binding protein